jgi:hypothetical protein
MSYVDDGFILTFKGDVTIQELNQANSAIHQHPNFDIHRYQIVNFLDADLSSVTENDGRIPAQLDSIAARKNENVNVAFVAQGAHTLRVVEGYLSAAQASNKKWKFRAFSTFVDALAWSKNK